MKRIIAILVILISMFIWFHCRGFLTEYNCNARVWTSDSMKLKYFWVKGLYIYLTDIHRKNLQTGNYSKKRQLCYVCYVFIIQSRLIKIVYKKPVNMDWLILYSFQETKNIWLPAFLRKPNMIFVVVTTYSGEVTSSKIQLL